MEAFLQKIRELVLDGYAEGLGTADIAGRFKVSARRKPEDRVRLRHALHRPAVK